MAKNKRSNIQYRRRREKKTDYKQRLGLLKSKKLRLIVRRRSKSFIIQLVEFKNSSDITISSVSSKDLIKLGWKHNPGNTPSAYLLGLIIGTKNQGKEAILDIGLQKSVKGSSIYAAAKGAIDGGIKIKISKEIFPTEERISGKHISDDVEKNFNEIKAKIK